MTGDRSLRASSFGARAEVYDETRPSYPDSLVETLLSLLPTDVVDVGAGTGKLTRLLVAAGLAVTAVEPDPGMRAVLARRAPGATVLAGTGEELPLPDASVDLVTYAQAWHWTDPLLAAREATRVLRPGGVLALIWNSRDPRICWQESVETVMRSGGDPAEIDRMTGDLVGFDRLPVQRHPWLETISRADYLQRAGTWSAVSILPDSERLDALRRLRDILDTAPETAGQQGLELHQIAVLAAYRGS